MSHLLASISTPSDDSHTANLEDYENVRSLIDLRQTLGLEVAYTS